MKPTLLYLITQDSWGGAQRYVYDLATHLYQDYRVVIGIGGDACLPHGLHERIQTFNAMHGSAIELVQIPHLVRPLSPIDDLRALYEIRKIYKKLKPTVVHLNSSKAGILGSIASMRTTISTVYTVHGWVFREPLSRVRAGFYQLSEQLTRYCKDAFIVLSEEEKTIGEKMLHIPEKKMTIIPLGIEEKNTYHSASDARKKLGIESSDTRIHLGVIANFFATKGLNTLVEALRIVSTKQTVHPYHVHLIGDGPTREWLESKIKEYRLETVLTLHGFIPEAETLIRAFDLFLIPSLKEGLPYALLESVHMGIPVIATEVGGIPSFAVLSRGNIQLVPPNNPHAQAIAIIDALSRSRDVRTTTAKSQLPPVFSLSHMITKTTTLYTDIITRGV